MSTVWHAGITKVSFFPGSKLNFSDICKKNSISHFLSRRFSREKSRLKSWLFVSVFLHKPKVTKIVLTKVLQNFILPILAQGTEPKRFLFFSRNIQYWARLKGPPFSFCRHFATFFDFFFT